MYRSPPQEDLFQLAIAVAKVAHSGDRRRGNGEPYFNHVERVAESVYKGTQNLRAATIAYLHDTIEDTTVTKETLLALGFGTRIVHDVVMLTRSVDETYGSYIARLMAYATDEGLSVKLADLADNLRDLDELPVEGDAIERLRQRYRAAQENVMAELDRRTAAVDFARNHRLSEALVA